jgi:hypothetical protein
MAPWSRSGKLAKLALPWFARDCFLGTASTLLALSGGRRIDERPDPQAPRFFVLGILAIDLHYLDLLRLNISLSVQIKIHLSGFARAL